MTADKLTAAGLKASLKVQRYLAFSGAPSLGAEPQNPLVVVHGYAMVRKDIADVTILALEDMRTQMMARIAKLEAENERLKTEQREALDD